jgi:predicted transcriptional regulator
LISSGTFGIASDHPEPIWVAVRTDKIISVFNGMIHRNILSVPVLVKTDQHFYGFIEITDIIRYIVNHFGTRLGTIPSYMQLINEEKEFHNKTVAELMAYPYAAGNPHKPTTQQYSVLHALEIIAKEPGKCIGLIGNIEQSCVGCLHLY